jgi:hypothetical protein
MTLDARQLVRPWWRQPSFVMLSLLLASLVLYPFADYAREYRVIVQVVDIAIVLQVVHLVRAVGYWIPLGWLLSVPLVALQVATLATAARWIEPSLLSMQVLFHGYAVVALLAYILNDTVITLDELFAIAAAYVLMALLWASAYALLVHFHPHAIFINPTNNPDGVVSFAELVYFSMTTLTSVGLRRDHAGDARRARARDAAAGHRRAVCRDPDRALDRALRARAARARLTAAGFPGSLARPTRRMLCATEACR